MTSIKYYNVSRQLLPSRPPDPGGVLCLAPRLTAPRTAGCPASGDGRAVSASHLSRSSGRCPRGRPRRAGASSRRCLRRASWRAHQLRGEESDQRIRDGHPPGQEATHDVSGDHARRSRVHFDTPAFRISRMYRSLLTCILTVLISLYRCIGRCCFVWYRVGVWSSIAPSFLPSFSACNT